MIANGAIEEAMTSDQHANGGEQDHGRAMRGATVVLHAILDDLERAGSSQAQAAGRDAPIEASLGDVLERLDERAYGFLLLLLALPCCLPFVYLLPQIVALPMLALAAQLAAGREHPWLPKKLRERRFPVAMLKKVVARSERYVGWVERFARPRLRPATGRLGARLTGALLLIPTASILVPLPSTNTMPGIGVAIAALGLIERDGVLTILGLLIGFIWVALLLTLGLSAADLIRDWLSARL